METSEEGCAIWSRSTFVNNKQHKAVAFIDVAPSRQSKFCLFKFLLVKIWTGGRRPDIHMWCLLLSAIVSLSLNPYPELISIIVDICHLPSLLITLATFASFSGSLDQWVLWFRLWIAKLRNAQIGVKLCKSFCLFQAQWLWGVQRGMKLVKHCSHFVAPMLMMTVMVFRVLAMMTI